jgi:hypothetical protein
MWSDAIRGGSEGVISAIEGVSAAKKKVVEEDKAESDKLRAENLQANRDASLMTLMQSGKPIMPRDFVMIYGPDQGMKMAGAWGQLVQKDKPINIPVLLTGFKASSDEVKAQSWPFIRERLHSEYGDAVSTMPPAWGPEAKTWLDQQEANMTGQKPVDVGPGHKLMVGDKVVSDNPAAPEEKVYEPGSFEGYLTSKFGEHPTPEQVIQARTEFQRAGQAPPSGSNNHEDARMDKSYQFNSSQLEAVRKPIIDQAARFNRLVETVNQGTPQADALIAPELLTVMAGGAGSGLRMNEAEISRIVGGRSNLETIKAALNKWTLDPTKALSITPAQRVQVRQLIEAAGGRLNEQIATIDKANQELVDGKTVDDHRRTLANVKSKLAQLSTSGKPGGARPIPPGARPGTQRQNPSAGRAPLKVPASLKSDAEIDSWVAQLPSGAVFIDPEGNARRVP